MPKIEFTLRAFLPSKFISDSITLATNRPAEGSPAEYCVITNWDSGDVGSFWMDRRKPNWAPPGVARFAPYVYVRTRRSSPIKERRWPMPPLKLRNERGRTVASTDLEVWPLNRVSSFAVRKFLPYQSYCPETVNCFTGVNVSVKLTPPAIPRTCWCRRSSMTVSVGSCC